MTVWGIVGAAVVTALLALTLRQTQPAAAMALSLLCGVMLLGGALALGVPAIERVTVLLEATADTAPYTDILLKALGISLLTQMASDVCRDAGESALAGKAELAGRVLLILCGLPLFEHAAALLESIILGEGVAP